MQTMPTSRRQWVHLLACGWHIVSAVVFIVVVASFRSDAGVPRSFRFRVPISASAAYVGPWETLCYDKLSGTTFPTATLDYGFAAEKRCITTVRALPIDNSVLEIPVVGVPAFCAFWSAAVHLACFVHLPEAASMRIIRFWGDYAVTAPLMLAATSTLWGARNVIAVVVHPFLLLVLLLNAPPLEDALVKKLRTDRTLCGAAATLAAFCLTTIAPPIDGAAASLPPDAPSSVWVAVMFFVVTFSFFLVPYCLSIYERVKRQNVSDKDGESESVFAWYTACSMVAKTTLHANVALVAATQLLVGAQPFDRKPRITMDNAGGAAAVASVLSAVGGVLMACIYKFYLKQR